MPIYCDHVQPEPLFCCVGIDQFAAQVIMAYDPAFNDKPFVVIRQNADSHKSTVWACSLSARRLGIREGIPVSIVTNRFPGIGIIARNEEYEKTAREELQNLLCSFSPVFDVANNGRAMVDVTGTPIQREAGVIEIGMKIAAEIRSQIGLQEISIGMARTRLMASLMERLAPSGGIRECEPGREESMLNALDTSLLPGLSGQCREKLKKYGLRKIGQVRRLPRDALMLRFGVEGEKLYSMVHEFDLKTTVRKDQACDAETVFGCDTNDEDSITHGVWLAADKLCHRIRSTGATAQRITVILRYTDNKTTQRTITLGSATNDFLTIVNASVRAFRALYQRRVGIRSIRLVVKQVKPDTGQIDLFETTWEQKQKAVSRSVTAVRLKMKTFDAVVSGGNVKDGKRDVSSA